MKKIVLLFISRNYKNWSIYEKRTRKKEGWSNFFVNKIKKLSINKFVLIDKLYSNMVFYVKTFIFLVCLVFSKLFIFIVSYSFKLLTNKTINFAFFCVINKEYGKGKENHCMTFFSFTNYLVNLPFMVSPCIVKFFLASAM